MTGADYHRPALVSAVLGYLVGDPAGLYLDGTVGGGGHAAAILTRCPRCRLLGLDRDGEAVAAARTRLAPFGDRVRLAQLSFREVAGVTEVRLERLAGALLDLGA
ncbi:MAG: 16S rRNA (cytosine(1402)-N(4))-methyltransferase, partial [Gemmatimonadetes bacterium]|nr:16S rRNA (cytosine(1402)-N(4))-methyltransferase [Gemmatimonadota bacterium]